MTDFFEMPERWVLPDFIWKQSLEDMALDGAKGCEGVALWLGRHHEGAAVISACVLLRGPGVVKRPNHLSISAGLMNQVTMAALELDLILIGQVHSHSPLASTDLSYPDRYLGITERGYLSLVAPDFAQNPATRLAHCGVHVHEGAAGWRRMAAAEISSRFELPDLTPHAPLVIGGPA
ncbi:MULTISPECIES: hypothetical protein [unclassified Sphingomonas]|uniref:hypothetical protein n=1 Tax=unclassified Sphingomonas TaxID=196159 RepID=UPI00092CD4A2|nr:MULTISPECIES: hypothetical protein [unclassified Sphingomonas]MBN8847145.1 hypothetical protein [Sphingomonas sp.]OJV32603.1 MAG: hypothetical protein BGO24_02335 [Sphingomonas sp. 67-36]